MSLYAVGCQREVAGGDGRFLGGCSWCSAMLTFISEEVERRSSGLKVLQKGEKHMSIKGAITQVTIGVRLVPNIMCGMLSDLAARPFFFSVFQSGLES